MSIDEFYKNPWQNSHKAYDKSAFSIKPAPEFSTGEVLLASLYRALGFKSCSESSVPANGRNFEKVALKQIKPGHVSPSTWEVILKNILESPKRPKQSSQRFLSLTPLVPEISLYSGSPRLKGNPWNPGSLIQRLIRSGSQSEDDARLLWKELYDALSISDKDDVWARWLHEEFSWRSNDKTWELTDLDVTSLIIPSSDLSEIQIPAKQFVKDIRSIIEVKNSMTRRQWTSLLEATIRLGLVTHVLWLCCVNDRLWKLLSTFISDPASAPSSIVSKEYIVKEIISNQHAFLSYGNPALPIIKSISSSYLAARLGINQTLWFLDNNNIKIEPIHTPEDILNLIKIVSKNRLIFSEQKFHEKFLALKDKESKTIACKTGSGSNLEEFILYSLGQRQTANENLRGYDQGYFLRKRSSARNSPWVFLLGPVAVLSIVHSCLSKSSGPRSVKSLVSHMQWYGVDVDIKDIVDGDLGSTLRQLGLVIDSPDAESGMLLTRPFV